MDIATFKRRLFEELDSSADISSKDYVINVVKDMYKNYVQYFSKKLGTDDIESLYEKFSKDIFPGFADFIMNAEHTFGCDAFPEITGYLSVKHGCWLNSLDFINKYNDLYKKDGNVKLCYGFMIHKDDLEKVEKDISNGLVPVGLKVIPHGFIVLSSEDGDKVFDPTIGANKEYHYFFKEVPEEIWKSFKYYYNNPKDWNVNDFADWTSSKIREELSTHAFQTEVGEVSVDKDNMSVEDQQGEEQPENNEDDFNLDTAEDNQEVVPENNSVSAENQENIPVEQSISNDDGTENMNNINFEDDNFLSNNNDVYESADVFNKQNLQEASDKNELISDEEILQIIAGIAKEQEATYSTSSMRYALEIASPEQDFKKVYNILKSHTPRLPIERDLTQEEAKYLKSQLDVIYKDYVTKKEKPVDENEFSNGDIILKRDISKDEKGAEIVSWYKTDEMKALQPVRLTTNSQNKASEIMKIFKKVADKGERYEKAYLSQLKFLTKDGLYGDVTDDIKGNHVERSAKVINDYMGYLVTSETLQPESGDYEISCSFVVPQKLYLDTRGWIAKDKISDFIEKVVEFSDKDTETTLKTGNEGRLNKIIDFSDKSISNETKGKEFPKAIINYDVEGRSLVTIRLHNLDDSAYDLSQSILKGKNLIKEKFKTADGSDIFFSWYTNDNAESIKNDQALKDGLLSLNIPFRVIYLNNEDGKIERIFDSNEMVKDISFGDKDHFSYEAKETESGLEIVASKKDENQKTDLEKVVKDYISKSADKLFLYKVNNNTLLISKSDNLQFEKLHEELSADTIMDDINKVSVNTNSEGYKWKLNSSIQPLYKVYKPLKGFEELLFIEGDEVDLNQFEKLELDLERSTSVSFRYNGEDYKVLGLTSIVGNDKLYTLNTSVHLKNTIFLKAKDVLKCMKPLDSVESMGVLQTQKQKPFGRDKNLIDSLNDFANRVFEEIKPYAITEKQIISFSKDDIDLYISYTNEKDEDRRQELKKLLEPKVESILKAIKDMNIAILNDVQDYADKLEDFCKEKSNEFMRNEKNYHPGLAYAKIVRTIDDKKSSVSVNGNITFSDLSSIVSRGITNTLSSFEDQKDTAHTLDGIVDDLREKRLKKAEDGISSTFGMPIVLKVQPDVETITLDDIIKGEKAWLSQDEDSDNKITVGSGLRFVKATSDFKLASGDTTEEIKNGDIIRLNFTQSDVVNDDGTKGKVQNLSVETNVSDMYEKKKQKRVSLDENTGLLVFESYDDKKDQWNVYGGNVDSVVFCVNGDWQYEGQEFHQNDLAIAEYDGFQPKLTKIDEKVLDAKMAEYKQIAKAYSAGQNASQIEIMEVMKYCRGVGLFTDSTENLGPDASITTINRYGFYKGLTKGKDLGYSIIFNLGGNSFFENKKDADSANTSDDPEHYITEAGKAVIDTLNSYFLNVAAIVATRDTTAFSSNVQTLEELGSKFKELVRKVDKAQEELDQEQDPTKKRKLLTSTQIRKIAEDVLGSNYIDYMSKFKTYAEVFKASGKFERKDFFTKVLGVEIQGNDEESRREVDNLDSASNKIFAAFKSDKSEILRDFIDFYVMDRNSLIVTGVGKRAKKKDRSNDTIDVQAITYPYLFSISDEAKPYGSKPMKVFYDAIKGSTTMDEFKELLNEQPTSETLSACASRLGLSDSEDVRDALGVIRAFYISENEKIQKERDERKEARELRKLGKTYDTDVLLTTEQQLALAAGRVFRDLVLNRYDLVKTDLAPEIADAAKKDLVGVAVPALVRYLTTYSEAINPKHGEETIHNVVKKDAETGRVLGQKTFSNIESDTVISWWNEKPWYLFSVIAKGKDTQVMTDGERFGNDPIKMLTDCFGLDSTSERYIGTLISLMIECLRYLISNENGQEYQELKQFQDEVAYKFKFEDLLKGFEDRSNDYKSGKVGSSDYQKQQAEK